MSGMIEEFKKFALRGNVIDMAVGVIIGGAFGKIVNSLVEDVIMPPIGLVLAKVDFSELYINLGPGTFKSLAEARTAGAAAIAYGEFLTDVLNFLIVSFVIFLMVKQMNRLKLAERLAPPPPAPAAPKQELLLTEI